MGIARTASGFGAATLVREMHWRWFGAAGTAHAERR
jgi:hypothetical protein